MTATPSTSPTNSTSITFNYSDSQSGVTFSCTLDGTAKTCTGTTSGSVTFNSLPQGSHTFQIQAVSGNKSSSATSYTWTVDTTAPTVSSITRAGSSPTNASSVAWTVTFSEPVRNVATSNFQVVAGGVLGGTPTVTGVSGSGATYTVTASAGSGDGTLQLNLSTKGTIADLAGNALASTFNGTGSAYTLDRTPPPAPTLTQTPPNPQSAADTSATFAWTDSDPDGDALTYYCSLDGSTPAVCTSPTSYSVNKLQQGSHTFAVYATEAPGNQSPTTSFTWNIVQPVKNFTISGNAPQLLYPGVTAQALNLTIGNPNNYSMTVTSITVTIAAVTKAQNAPAGTCNASNFAVANYSGSGFTAPSGTSTLQSDGVPQAQWPTVRMINTSSAQDACKGATISLGYQGIATK